MTAAITIHFREPKITAACIDSLVTDGWAPILVWDNSEDGGTSLRTLELRYRDNEHVQTVHNPQNLGFGRGMNAALAELRCRGYAGPVLLVNNDTIAIQGMREALLAQLMTKPSSTLVAPRIMQGGRVQGWMYYQPWWALVTQRALPGSFAYLSGCCLLVNRPDNGSPLFDEAFFMYGEDVELSWRMRRHGGGLILLDEVWLRHEGSASSGQTSEAYERFLVRSHWVLADKLAVNAVEKAFMHALRFPFLLARACLRTLRYRSVTPLRALTAIRKRD